MGEEIAVENGRISDFRGLVNITRRPLHTHQILLKSKTFLWKDVRTDGHLRQALIVRLGGVYLKISRGKLQLRSPFGAIYRHHNSK